MKTALLIIAAALYAASPYLGVLPGWTPSVATVATFIALSLIGMNLIFGVAGMLAFGQAAIVALPGYVAGMLEASGMPAAAAIPAGILAAVAAARIVGEIFIRLPGTYFAIGTLGFAFVMEGVARAFPSTTGGASGLMLSREIVLGELGWYVLALATLAAGIACYVWFLRGSMLRTLRQVRHDELAAEVLGIDVVRTKLRVFTVGSVFSAVGGVFLAHYVGVVVPDSAGVIRSLEQLAMVIIGGAGSAAGPLVGAALVQWLFVAAGEAGRFEVLVYGAGFLLAVLFAPEGIVGLVRRGWAGLAPARKAAPISVPATPVPGVAAVRRSGICLKVESVAKNFGGLQAVDNVSLEVPFGVIVALIGPNGAGKTTLYNILSGIEEPSSGRVLIEDSDMASVPPHRRARHVGRSFQVARLVPQMSVLENVAVRADQLGFTSEAARLAAAGAQLAWFGLGELAGRRAAELGSGYHKLVELARAAVGEPALLLLDEPAVGLAPEEIERLCHFLTLLRERGAAILIVEHNVALVARIAERIFVMNQGRIIAAGTGPEIMADPKVREAYLGALE